MGEEQPADVADRHEAQRDTALTARERQDWRDVETLLAEVERLRTLLADLAADFPPGARSAGLEAARAYLAGEATR